ncbi:MAG TPA: D-alanine--D-alanine ligase family protein [Candidatus Nanopelagicales bacterium]|nr:D-alanine--D-alanine ligase family protein [Candidatus Nanopelagicales bacterium]
MRERIRVAVVFGGRSSEHAISCVSAGSVLRALDRERYDVVPVGVTPDGRWVLEADEPDRLAITDGKLPEVDAGGTSIVLAADPTRPDLEVHEANQVPESLGTVDVVFPVLHGPFGEDGTIQGLLEMAGVPYVGSGVLASAVAMDKGAMKTVFAQAGLEQAPYVVITDRDWRRRRDESLARVAELGLPVFVKPARAGSSLGITKVRSAAAIVAAIEEARRHDPRVVVEASVEGAREVECGVLVDADGEPRASVCAEIVVHGEHEFYDFEAKYLDDAADLVVPADLAPEVAARVQELAVLAFDALGCEGLARCDFFVLPDGRVLVNEVNTMPGFTSISMFPRVWAESGVDYPALVDRLVADALRRGTGLR